MLRHSVERLLFGDQIAEAVGAEPAQHRLVRVLFGMRLNQALHIEAEQDPRAFAERLEMRWPNGVEAKPLLPANTPFTSVSSTPMTTRLFRIETSSSSGLPRMDRSHFLRQSALCVSPAFRRFRFEELPQSRPMHVGDRNGHHLAAGSYTGNDKLLAEIFAETADAIDELVHLLVDSSRRCAASRS